MTDAYAKISTRAEELYPEAVTVRRQLHRWPEEGFKEYKTSAYVIDFLSGLPMDSVRAGVAGTGVVAELKGSLPGPVLAIRADMDGLPITEKTGLEYASEHEGWMHGCGHDAHTAGLLMTAKLLSGMKDELPGTVRFLFQPAEEGPGGAAPMVKEGALQGVDIVIGGHVWGGHKAGQVALKPGALFAAPDEFRIRIQGTGGHAATPHLAVDTVPIMAEIVQALQTVVSRKVEAGVPCVITVGTVQAGYRFNVIADTCYMTGTVRTFDKQTQELARRSIEELATGIASAMGAKAEVEYIYRYPALVNDPDITRRMEEAAVRMLGRDNVVEAKPIMGGEDFSFFLNEAPGTFLFIGSANEPGKYWNTPHHPCFNIDEKSLLCMMKVYSAAPFWLSGGKAGQLGGL